MGPERLKDGFAVFTQEETRLVRGTATLYDFNKIDSVYGMQLLIPRTVDLTRLVVPVFEGDQKVGAATLFYDKGRVMALITFDYETPERLDLMLGLPVHAIPRGDYMVDPMHPKCAVLDTVDITGISLEGKPVPRAGIGSPISVTRYICSES